MTHERIARHVGVDEIISAAESECLSDVLDSRIGVVDFFSVIRVSVDAEIMLVATSSSRPHACRVAFRVDSMLKDPSMYFVVTPSANEMSGDCRVRLRLFGRDVAGGSLSVAALEFTSFADFIRAPQ